MSVKLSSTQQAVLNRMLPKIWHTAYDLQCSKATLDALHSRGLVDKKFGPGSMFSPRTNIYYKRADTES